MVIFVVRLLDKMPVIRGENEDFRRWGHSVKIPMDTRLTAKTGRLLRHPL